MEGSASDEGAPAGQRLAPVPVASADPSRGSSPWWTPLNRRVGRLPGWAWAIAGLIGALSVLGVLVASRPDGSGSSATAVQPGGDGAAPTTVPEAAASPAAGNSGSASPSSQTTPASRVMALPIPSLAALTGSGPAAVAGAAVTHLEGTGTGRVALAKPGPGVVVAQLSHGGVADFVVHPLDASGQRRDALVNAVGAYRGSRLLDTDGIETTQLEIGADGPWSIDLVALPGAPAWSGREPVSGQGDAVLIAPGGLDRLTVAQITHGGARAFAVWAYTTISRDLVVNDVGRHDGRHAFARGVLVVAVTADGPWSITPRGA